MPAGEQEGAAGAVQSVLWACCIGCGCSNDVTWTEAEASTKGTVLACVSLCVSLFACPCAQHPELQQQQYQADPRAEQAWRRQQQQQRGQPQQQVLTRLLELSLQFCIYTEAANLRHTPHLLFLIYYVLRGSSEFLQVRCWD